MTTEITTQLKKYGAVVLEPLVIRLDPKRFIEIGFTDLQKFIAAILSYSLKEKNPILEMSSSDDNGLFGYSEDVLSIYTMIVKPNILLRFYEMKKEGVQE